MAVYVGAISKFGNLGVAYPECAGEVTFNKFVVVLTAAQLVVNTIAEIGILPAGCTVVDAVLRSTDLDTDGTPAVTLDVGLMSGEVGVEDVARTVGQEIFAAATTAQAGGSTAMAETLKAGIAPTATNRAIGVKVATAPDAAATGTITLLVWIAADRTPA